MAHEHRHTETHCHCGHDRCRSDHCPACGCEEFEAVCGHVHDAQTCDCPWCERSRADEAAQRRQEARDDGW